MSLIARVRPLHHLRMRSSIWAMSKRRHFTEPAAITFDDPSNFYHTVPHRSPPTDRVWRLVNEMTGLTQIEAIELSNITMDMFCRTLASKLSFKERYVIRLTRPDVVVAEKPGGGKPELKKAFDLRIESFEVASKLKVIKDIRGFMELGLKEAK